MNRLIMLVVFLLVVMCSDIYSKGMTHEEVVDSFENETSGIISEMMSILKVKEYNQRKNNLVPLKMLMEDVEISNVNEDEKDYLNRKGIDLSDKDTPIKKQWNGTCTAFGGVAGMENLLEGKVHLSERDMWSKYKKYSSAAFVKAAKKYYICEEKYWKQDNWYPSSKCKKNRNYRLFEDVPYMEEDIEGVLDALDKKHPVYLAMSVPKDMLNCRKTIRSDSKLYQGAGHAILIVGYQINKSVPGGGYFKIKNSWGADCGDGGYQYLPFSLWSRTDMYTVTWEFKAVKVKSTLQ